MGRLAEILHSTGIRNGKLHENLSKIKESKGAENLADAATLISLMTIIIKTVNNIRKGRKPEEKTIEDLGEQTKRYKEAMKIKKRSESL